ncbi:zinc transport system substrate-binding protein [Thermodesulfitimonas autotrophica]|uniref:Zinc transport system substrate-binding protein n=1 Tax=Thermodesulfitimonas autotrophica TaxID=1894989 RepID=A0A3N5BS78_9THEO|nr:metal ABC transporter substrate-binding protein [Thermodesulfitimonas autotrophica]RPF46611.1 zinc transport system substrate-binding protein [Thermodesulfitimonas autotrophica]
MRLVIAVVLLLCLLLGGCAGDKEGTGAGKVQVVATFFPLYDFARQVGGERVEVTCLVPPGVSVHEWEPTARDVRRVLRADLFVYNGAGLEPWVDRVLPEFRGRAVVEATRGLDLMLYTGEGEDHAGKEAAAEHHHHGPYDPHAWLDPVRAQHYVRQIAAGLSRVDPAGKAYYETRAAAYIERLAALDRAYREATAHFKRREIVTAHAAFGYLAARYGLRQIPVAGLSPQAEPSPARLQELVTLVRQHGVKCIFFDAAVSPRLAETLAREAGVKSLVLSPAAGLSPEEKSGQKDYVAVMEDNLAVLITALGGEGC